MSGATEPSHVLLAMGLTPGQARSSLRLSLSRLTTDEEIDRALEIIPASGRAIANPELNFSQSGTLNIAHRYHGIFTTTMR